MDSYIDIFCSVLRAGLWNKAPEADLRGADFKRIWADAQKQAVSGLVAQGLLNTGRMHPKASEMLQKKILSIAAMNFKISHILADAVKALRSGGIEPILLKGHGVASYYHQPLLRECGDIDLYVRPDQYKRAFDILSDNIACIEEKKFEESEKHSTIVTKGIPIELHQFADVLVPRYNDAFQSFSDAGIASDCGSVDVDDIIVHTPGPTFNVMYILEHIWSHFVAAGVGFRQICDWSLLLHANQSSIDRKSLFRMLDELDLVKPWKVFGLIAVRQLGLPEGDMPFFDLSVKRESDKVLGMIMKEGNFGHEWDERWAESGHRFLDTSKHFIVITRRYLKVIPMFGNIAFQEYKTKILYHLWK